jgi:G protein-coupled receptor GPR1
MTTPSAYENINFCDVVGVFTVFAIESADFAVFFIAIHTALIVFFSNKGPEGGLYKYRYYVYGITIILPIFMACIAFVGNGRGSYKPYITWCYLPQEPLWYRLVLSWVPRYIIMIMILAIYLSIYIFVRMQLKEVVKNFKQSQKYATRTHESWGRRAWNATVGFIANFPGFAFLLQGRDVPVDGTAGVALDNLTADDTTNGGDTGMGSTGGTGALSHGTNEARQSAIVEFQRESMMKFQIRRNVIERQVRSVFVYPIAYLFLWAFPLALQCLQYNPNRPAVYWVRAAAAFMQPFNCTVDTVAFCIRETPWRDREERVFTTYYIRKFIFRRQVDREARQEADDSEEKNVAFGRSGGRLVMGPSNVIDEDGRVLRFASTGSTVSPLTHIGRAPADLSPGAARFPDTNSTIDNSRSSADESEEIDIFEFLR